MTVSSADFYASLVPFRKFSELTESSHYRKVPDDWWIVITDVKGSTKAIENNRYKDVNIVGASSIIAVLNLMRGQQVPFVFGGDGATLLVHESDVDRIKPALLGTQRLARDVFGFELRTGLVPMSQLSANGEIVEVAKFAISENATIATMRGGGLSYAEKLVKDPAAENQRFRLENDGSIVADVASFEGLSCRWNPIKAQRGEIMSLLIVATDLAKSDEVYRRVIRKIEHILDERESHPVTPEKMGGVNYLGLIKEMRMHTIDRSIIDKFRAMGMILFEVAVMQIFKWTGFQNARFSARAYIQEMGENTDFQKFDDMVRMVRDCTFEQRDRLLQMLKEERAKGAIAYGVHLSNEALLTCLVLQLDNHIHFVDGSGGGYALAAKQLKEQLKERSNAK